MASAEPAAERQGAGPQTVRRHNLALVLREVAGAEPLSRARIAQRTGLTRGTVSSLVDELLVAGYLTELAAERGRTGRPANPLQLNRSGPAGLGIEIGVDTIGVCVVDLSGAVRAREVVPSRHRSHPADDGLRQAARLARHVAEGAGAMGLTVVGAGVALPGMVGVDGVLLRAPNLPGWVDVDAGPALAAALGGIPVTVANEADLAALAELWFGNAPPDFVFVSGGIGVGAGVVLGGELFRGAGGRAGELGHVVVDPDGPACRCGGRGCLERVAGAEALPSEPERAIPIAGRALGIALAGAVNLLDVRTVVLGGMYGELGSGLVDAVMADLTGRLPIAQVTVLRSGAGTGGALRAAAATVVRQRLRAP